jgi:hypothetical protein
MAINSAFQAQGLTFNVTTNATPSTASAQTIQFVPTSAGGSTTATYAGINQCPTQARVVNTGTGIVYLSITSAARVAVIPTAGVPQQEYPILPGEDIVFTLNTAPQPSLTGTVDQALFINTISTVASQVLNITFGEGM